MLVVDQSASVGSRTMLSRLLCCCAVRLLPTRRQRALTLHLRQHPHAQRITEMAMRKDLCETERSCQEGFISFSDKNHINPVEVKAVCIFESCVEIKFQCKVLSLKFNDREMSVDRRREVCDAHFLFDRPAGCYDCSQKPYLHHICVRMELV